MSLPPDTDTTNQQPINCSMLDVGDSLVTAAAAAVPSDPADDEMKYTDGQMLISW